ncbi:ParB N-terminal domain-containing protein [bacterium]|nr:ParB N-terminal domain-containing protein [bacterium]
MNHKLLNSNDFYLGACEPIFLNSSNYIIDGQHRLATAKTLGLKYMDVVIIDEENENK